jgi:epoxide hydrolase-like predicted phosphatase
MREKMSPAKQKIESVIFDLGGVLIEDPVPRILQYCAAFLQADPGRLRSAHCRHAPDFQKGAISEELFWNRICSEISTLMPRIHSLWGEAFRMAYSEKKEVLALASQIHKRDYKTGLLSDTEMPAMNYFLGRKYDGFDFMVFSCSEGVAKPEEKIYRIALDRSGTDPGKTAFIDDKRANVEGARKLGIAGILFRNPGQVKADLESIGIEIGQN